MVSSPRGPVPPAFHAIAAAYVACCFWLASRRPAAYAAAMQEDRVVEWLTVGVFAAAGVVVLRRAARERRIFDGLVALFLLFVAGEEMSWGQRVFGVTPPAYFLEHNTQQEMNVHNFANLFGGPKEPFTFVLIGYAVLMPVVASVPAGRVLLARMGATPPPYATIPWFLAAIVLFTWYPLRFTGEWTELLAGSAFLMSAGMSGRALVALAPLVALSAIAMSAWSGRGSGDRAHVACAAAELEAIVTSLRADDLGGDAHKRAWTLAEEHRIDIGTLRARLQAVRCADAVAGTRRRYAVDPWGTAYWIRVERDAAATAVTAYSFGPNRRRDVDSAAVHSGDDIVVHRALGP